MCCTVKNPKMLMPDRSCFLPSWSTGTCSYSQCSSVSGRLRPRRSQCSSASGQQRSDSQCSSVIGWQRSNSQFSSVSGRLRPPSRCSSVSGRQHSRSPHSSAIGHHCSNSHRSSPGPCWDPTTPCLRPQGGEGAAEDRTRRTPRSSTSPLKGLDVKLKVQSRSCCQNELLQERGMATEGEE